MLTTRPIVTAHDVIAACITSLTQHIVLIARIYFAFPMGLLTFNDLELQRLGVNVLRNPLTHLKGFASLLNVRFVVHDR